MDEQQLVKLENTCESEHKDEGGEELECKATQKTEDGLRLNSKAGLEACSFTCTSFDFLLSSGRQKESQRTPCTICHCTHPPFKSPLCSGALKGAELAKALEYDLHPPQRFSAGDQLPI